MTEKYTNPLKKLSFYYCKSVVFFGLLYHLYNHSFTTNTMVKL